MTQEKKNTKVTVYIPNNNYNRYFKEAIQSIIDQTYKNWELLLIIDGYNKTSIKISKNFIKKYKHKIKLFVNKKKRGLRYCSNLALNKSSGSYFTRLDADDFLNENAFLNFVEYLNKNRNIDLVYSDFFYVDKSSEFIDININEKILKKNSLLNLPAHGACSMIRTPILKKIGGYNSIFDSQDGYELWLNLLNKNLIGNINLPLFYYRQHEKSMSTNENRILEARRKIKRHFVQKKKLLKNLKILAVVGAKNKKNILFNKINNKYLLDYSLGELKISNFIDKVIVSTDDNKIVKYCNKIYNFDIYKRPMSLSKDFVTVDEIVFDVLRFSKKKKNFYPDIVIFINANAPCIKSKYIQKGLDSLVLFKTDSVISVYEDLNLHYTHSKNGLVKISKKMHEQLRIYRDALFVDNRSIRVSWSKVIKKKNMLGKKIGHFLMKRSESINIKNKYDMWLSEKYLKDRKKLENI